MFHMLSPTFASPVNIQHVPTFARFRGQHVVNICSSRPPSDGLAQRTLKIKLERLKNRSKPPKKKSLKIARFFQKAPTNGANRQHFQHLQGYRPGQHSTLLSTFAANGVNIQHKQLRRSRQRFPTWLGVVRYPSLTLGRDAKGFFSTAASLNG